MPEKHNYSFSTNLAPLRRKLHCSLQLRSYPVIRDVASWCQLEGAQTQDSPSGSSFSGLGLLLTRPVCVCVWLRWKHDTDRKNCAIRESYEAEIPEEIEMFSTVNK